MLAGYTLALVALLPCLVSANPIQKRFTNKVIKSFRTGNCLSTQPGTQIQAGSLLYDTPCNVAVRWDISPGSGSVIITGTNFALDAGTTPSNNVPAKVWTSYPGLSQQTWYLTGDNRIAITGGNQCLDEGDNGPQTYQCTTGNTNQIWLVEDAPSGPSSSVVPPPSSSASASASASSSASSSAPSSSSSTTPPPTVTGRQLKFGSNANSCATVQGPYSGAGNGVFVNMGACLAPTDPAAATQLFNFMGNGQIMLAGTNFCLDAGVNPSNGVQMKLWQCYPGLSQQTWFFPGGTGLYRTSNNQCLDVDNSNNFKLQTWTCSQPDPQQQFFMA